MIPMVFDEDCEVSGFSLEGDVWTGYEGVEQIVIELRKAFTEVTCMVMDLQGHENGLEVRWCCQGYLVGCFWERHDPENSWMTLEGTMRLRCAYESVPGSPRFRAKLTGVHFFWEASTLQRLFQLSNRETTPLHSRGHSLLETSDDDSSLELDDDSLSLSV